MKRFFLQTQLYINWLFATLPLMVTHTFAQRGNPKVTYKNTSIDQMVYDFMQEKNIPGLVMAIVQAPYIPRVVGYGTTDVSTKLTTGSEKLASTRTLWAAGPISQAYMAVAIFQLYEQHKLDVNKPVGNYVKGLPEAWQKVTVMQLLQHASGIADYRNEVAFNITKNYAFTDLVNMIKTQPLQFEPGTKVGLSATNFLLLSEVVEKASGMSYHDYVWKYQLHKLGLKNTIFIEDRKLLKEDANADKLRHELFKSQHEYINPNELAQGYKSTEKGLQKVDIPTPSALKGFSDIYASAEDISLWDIGLAGNVLVKEKANRDLIYKPTTLSNGTIVPAMAGWQFTRHQGFLDIGGSAPGFSAYLSRFTDARDLVCVTMLCNVENVDFTDLARRIAGAYDSSMENNVNPEYVFTMESAFSVKETMQNVETILKKNKVPVFAQFDHKENADKVSLSLKENQVIVFGNPAVGTYLMQETPAMSLDLPLKINVWQDDQNRVWLGFNQIKNLADKYDNKNQKVQNAIQKLLEKIAYNATHVYKQ